MALSRVLAVSRLLHTGQTWRDPNPERGKVTAIEHALACATKARRHNPDDPQMIVAALLHDAARPLSDARHGEVIAEVLRDRVRVPVYLALKRHGDYQAAILHDKPMPNGPAEARQLALWDATSFDPAYDSDTFGSFLPEMHAVLGDR